MAVTETSRDAYHTLTKMGHKQRLVYEQIKILEARAKDSDDLPSNADVAYELGWPINAITPRALELRKGGWLRVHGVKKDKATGRTVQTLCTADPNDKHLLDLVKEEQEDDSNWEPVAVSWLND